MAGLANFGSNARGFRSQYVSSNKNASAGETARGSIWGAEAFNNLTAMSKLQKSAGANLAANAEATRLQEMKLKLFNLGWKPPAEDDTSVAANMKRKMTALVAPALSKLLGMPQGTGSTSSSDETSTERSDEESDGGPRHVAGRPRGAAAKPKDALSRQHTGPQYGTSREMLEAEQQRREELRLQAQLRAVQGVVDWSKKPFVDRLPFSCFMAVVILLNAAIVGAQTDHDLGDVGNFLDNLFVLIYVAEFVARVQAHGVEFFYEGFNVFDTILVLLAVIEVWVLSGQAFRAFAPVRLVRMLRLVRLVRLVKFFKELYLVCVGLFHVIKTLGWVCVLLYGVLWVAAIFVSKALGQSQAWSFVDKSMAGPFEWFDNVEYFGSVRGTVFTLFQIMTLDRWAMSVIRPVCMVYPPMAIFFGCFVFVISYGLMNIINGVVVRDALINSKKNEDLNARMVEIERQKAVLSLQKFFRDADTDGDGFLTMDELHDAAEHKDAEALFTAMDLEAKDATRLFELLDKQNTGQLTIAQFIKGYNDAHSKGKDLNKLGLELNGLLAKTLHLENRMLAVQSEIGLVKKCLSAAYTAIEEQHHWRNERPNAWRQYHEVLEELVESMKPKPKPIELQKAGRFHPNGLARMVQSAAAGASRALRGAADWRGPRGLARNHDPSQMMGDVAPVISEAQRAQVEQTHKSRLAYHQQKRGGAPPVPRTLPGSRPVPGPPSRLPGVPEEPAGFSPDKVRIAVAPPKAPGAARDAVRGLGRRLLPEPEPEQQASSRGSGSTPSEPEAEDSVI